MPAREGVWFPTELFPSSQLEFRLAALEAVSNCRRTLCLQQTPVRETLIIVSKAEVNAGVEVISFSGITSTKRTMEAKDFRPLKRNLDHVKLEPEGLSSS